MTYADSTERAALIGGLRALADYLESNPEIPAPIYSHRLHIPAAWRLGGNARRNRRRRRVGSASPPA